MYLVELNAKHIWCSFWKKKQNKNSSHVKKTNKMTKASRRLSELSFLTEPLDKEVNEVQ